MEQDVIYDLSLQCLERLFREKATRQDVRVRNKRNKESDIKVIKTTYNSFCRDEARSLLLERCLFDVNKAVTEAYILANLHVVRCIDISRPVPKIDQNFFYRCLSAVSSSDQQKAELKDLDLRNTVRIYLADRPDGYVPADSSFIANGLFQQASKQMATMAKNSTSMEFWRRMKRYLKSKYDLDGRQAYEKTRDIRSRTYDGDDQIVTKYRSMIPRIAKIEDHPELVMPLQVLFLRHFEQRLEEERQEAEKHKEEPVVKKKGKPVPKNDKKCRLFSLLPTKKGFDSGHIKICSTGLYGLLKRSDIPDLPKTQELFRQQADVYWNRFFKIERFAPKHKDREFANEIVTDGRSVCITLRRPKREPSTSPEIKLEGHGEVWGLDPGRREIFVATNTEGNVARWSCKRYYHEAGFKRSAKKIKGWQEKDAFVKDTITNMPTKKSAHVSGLMRYLRFVLPRLDRMLRFGMSRRIRDLKFGRYVGKQKTLSRMCDDLTKRAGRDTLIGFGDWSNKDSAGIIKKSPAGPVKTLELELRKRCRVVSVDEFRSSKLHECCHRPMQNMYSERQFVDKKTGSKTIRTSKIHSVLLCRSRGCDGMRVNRDVNASRNMLMLLREQLQGRRPAAFSRATDLSSPVFEEQPGDG